MARSQRVGLSLKPNLDSAITELAKLTGHTKTSLINSILTKMLPSFLQSIELLDGQLKPLTYQEITSIVVDDLGKLSSDELIVQAAEVFNKKQIPIEGLENHATK